MPDGAGTSREREGSERALRCARRSEEENRALGATRKREDAEQALGHMNRRALERGRRIGLKEQEKCWCGLFRLFDGLKHVNATLPRERLPSWTKFVDM